VAALGKDHDMSVQHEFDDVVALVTGVSRPGGIGAAVAHLLHDLGATVVATGWPSHDAEMPWGSPPTPEWPFPAGRHDLEHPDAPAALIDEVIDRHGRLDVVVAAHARSSSTPLADVDADDLDRCWAANVRSIVLLAQRFAARHERRGPASGRMIWFTSGQHLAPMDTEIAYAVSKGALHQMTASMAHALADVGIVANCINPGPVDTGWADPATHRTVAERFPDQQWTSPAAIARLVRFLVSADGAVVRGQVIDAESGFDRFGR
jgi:3-oxoacyl-[acyl-carrier protein] reductase